MQGAQRKDHQHRKGLGKAAIFGADSSCLTRIIFWRGKNKALCCLHFAQTALLQQGEPAPFFPGLFHPKAQQKARCQAGTGSYW